MDEIVSREVLLLHGFTHTGASWEPVVGALAKRYRAIAPDIRGHGEASQRRPVGLTAVLADLDVLAGERFLLTGYSMGGRLALHLGSGAAGAGRAPPPDRGQPGNRRRARAHRAPES